MTLELLGSATEQIGKLRLRQGHLPKIMGRWCLLQVPRTRGIWDQVPGPTHPAIPLPPLIEMGIPRMNVLGPYHARVQAPWRQLLFRQCILKCLSLYWVINSCTCAKSLQSCLILCNPMDCSPPGSSVHEILQAGIQEWVAMPSSRGSSDPGIEPESFKSPALAGGFFTTGASWEVLINSYVYVI